MREKEMKEAQDEDIKRQRERAKAERQSEKLKDRVIDKGKNTKMKSERDRQKYEEKE